MEGERFFFKFLQNDMYLVRAVSYRGPDTVRTGDYSNRISALHLLS